MIIPLLLSPRVRGRRRSRATTPPRPRDRARRKKTSTVCSASSPPAPGQAASPLSMAVPRSSRRMQWRLDEKERVRQRDSSSQPASQSVSQKSSIETVASSSRSIRGRHVRSACEWPGRRRFSRGRSRGFQSACSLNKKRRFARRWSHRKPPSRSS